MLEGSFGPLPATGCAHECAKASLPAKAQPAMAPMPAKALLPAKGLSCWWQHSLPSSLQPPGRGCAGGGSGGGEGLAGMSMPASIGRSLSLSMRKLCKFIYVLQVLIFICSVNLCFLCCVCVLLMACV